MTKFTTNGCRPIAADSMTEAAHVFARRMARRQFGSRGDVRTCTQGSYAQDGSLAEFSAFIGATKGHETTGHNVNFTVYRS
jgi:hypothetical protein